jgi:5-methyltetrahydrofolate--homocysteine methyltransferase
MSQSSSSFITPWKTKELSMSEKLIAAIIEMREDDALKITDELLEGGTAPLEILDSCRKAMDVIGGQFEAGESFIP